MKEIFDRSDCNIITSSQITMAEQSKDCVCCNIKLYRVKLLLVN